SASCRSTRRTSRRSSGCYRSKQITRLSGGSTTALAPFAVCLLGHALAESVRTRAVRGLEVGEIVRLHRLARHRGIAAVLVVAFGAVLVVALGAVLVVALGAVLAVALGLVHRV